MSVRRPIPMLDQGPTRPRLCPVVDCNSAATPIRRGGILVSLRWTRRRRWCLRPLLVHHPLLLRSIRSANTVRVHRPIRTRSLV